LVSEETVGGRIRRSYGLTTGGATALRAEAQRMAEAARIVTSPELGTAAGLPGRKPRTA
jgi:DNA-binding PadR family transcriptional regulator